MKINSFLFLFILPTFIYAQNTGKKPLSENDYARWNTLDNSRISPAGNLVVYEANPQKGDGRLSIYNSATKTTKTVARGKRAMIGANDSFVAFTISPPTDTLRKAKIKKVKKEDMPQDSLGIFVFNRDSIFRFRKVKQSGVSEENAACVVFTTQAEAKKDTSKAAKKAKQVKQPGDDMVIFNAATCDTLVFHNVTEFHCPKKGGSVYFVQQKKDTTATYSKLCRFDSGKLVVSELFANEGFIKKNTTDERGEAYTFLFSKDTAEIKVYSLYLGESSGKTPEKIADKEIPGMPVGWSPSENGNLFFSKDGTKLFFGTAPAPVQEPKDTIPEEEKPKLDVWNWKDVTLQPQQKVELEREKKRTYLSVYHRNLKRFIQLADLNIREIRTIQKGNGELALGEDDSPYRRAGSWTGNSNSDFYLVDLKTGIKRMVGADKPSVWLSPAGKYIVWYEQTDSSYYAQSTDFENQKIVPLTRMLPVSFFDEENDLPDFPRPYGIAGWSENDRFIFICDRYDIWKIDPSGEKVPVNVTLASGRRNNIQYRYIQTDPDEEFIPAGKPSLLSAFNQTTMASGFSLADLHTNKEPQSLMLGNYRYGNPQKAKNADRLIWTRESATDFPDIWYSNLNFANPEKITSANPQQKDLNWLTVELVEWKSLSGENLKGLLYKPENFNPNLKYPMIVYFYERNSEGIHRYANPAPSRSTVNRTFYCSNGYLLFIPDITYKTGYPGQSAYNAIVSGVNHLTSTRPYINDRKIGLQGQSWGGYQTAYLITQTDIFAAAMAGAPVSNMTSAYGGIRWESGISRMFQYEHSQSRIGGTLWEKPLHYIENSPLFYAPKINTPLLMMANDNDGAVPWYQGIEFFVALRRLDKPAWMLTYNGEPHNLRGESWANRLDLDKRMFQFFNHYLKGAAMPDWMNKGVTQAEKGKCLGY